MLPSNQILLNNASRSYRSHWSVHCWNSHGYWYKKVASSDWGSCFVEIRSKLLPFNKNWLSLEINRCSIFTHKFHSFSGKCPYDFNFPQQSLIHFWLVENIVHLHNFRNWWKYFQLSYQSIRYNHKSWGIDLFVWDNWDNHWILDFELERFGCCGKTVKMPTCIYCDNDHYVYFCVNTLQW